MRRLAFIAALLLATGVAYAQVPPLGSGVVGWLQALYNQLSDGGASGPRTQIAAAATGSTGAVTATLAAAAGKTTFICGFNVSSIGTTAATTVAITVATLVGGVTQTYQNTVPITAASTVSQTFTPCIPGNATNSAITVSEAADANGTAVDVNAWGYQR